MSSLGQVEAFKKRDPYAVIIDKDSEPGTEIYKLSIREDVPVTWAGFIGDIIHNLRSALDVMAVALAVHNRRTSNTAMNETYFSIGASEAGFESKAAKELRYISPAAQRLVKRLKPYKGGTDAFWRLHKLDILDKHRALIPVGATNREILMTFDMSAMLAKMGIPLEEVDRAALAPIAFAPTERVLPAQRRSGIVSVRPRLP